MLLAWTQPPLGIKGDFKTTTSSWWQMGKLWKEWLLDWQLHGTLTRWWMEVAMATLPNIDLLQWLNIIYGLHRVRNHNSIKSEDKNSNFQSRFHLSPAWSNWFQSEKTALAALHWGRFQRLSIKPTYWWSQLLLFQRTERRCLQQRFNVK